MLPFQIYLFILQKDNVLERSEAQTAAEKPLELLIDMDIVYHAKGWNTTAAIVTCNENFMVKSCRPQKHFA